MLAYFLKIRKNKKIREFTIIYFSDIFLYAHHLFLFYAAVPEWSNGTGLGPVGLVSAQVRTLSAALFLRSLSGAII